MENKTAVEWLIERLPSLFVDDSGHYEKLFNQALELEKQQIMQAFAEGYYECENNSQDRQVTKNSYYSETYNKPT